MASLIAQTVKHLPTIWETWVWSPGWEDTLEKEMATHSSTLAWKIPWMKEPSMLQSMGSQSQTQNVPLVSLIFLKRSLVFPILSFSSISLHWSLRKVFLSLLAILWNSAFRWVYLFFLLCLLLLFSHLFLRPPQTPVCLFAFPFLGDGFGHHLLYNAMSLYPYFHRHSVYQI